MARVLLIDDQPAVLRLLSRALEEAGHEPLQASTAAQGVQSFHEHEPAVVATDLSLEGRNGLDVVAQVRRSSQVPIIMLSSSRQERQIVEALERGADDYLVKPVAGREFVARVEALLRRARGASEESYQDAALTMRFDEASVTVRGRPVSLTGKEYQLLSHLVRNRARVVGTAELLARIDPRPGQLEETVRWHVSRLRRKIEEDPSRPALVVTVRGAGYRYDYQRR